MIERGLVAHHVLHAAYPRRKLRLLDIQLGIGWKLASMTGRTQIIRAGDFHRAQGRQHPLGAQLMVTSALAAGTGHGALLLARGGKVQQLAQRCRTRPVEGRANRHLYRLQIHAALFAPLSKDATQELVYFPRHLLMNRSSRFFSSAVQLPASSTGRRRQIFSLTAISSALSL